ncbi:MAG: methyltransferase domain-containing protein [Egibacteraceae bacterium]
MSKGETVSEVDETRARTLLQQLTAELSAKGALRSPEWRTMFERTYRHPFVPRLYRRVGPDRQLLDGTRPEQREEWLAAVYRDDALVTQLDGDGQGVMSSSTAPTLMAIMLEALDVADGHRVLEIGTGTGYNAALLCARLGSELVTTIDIDAGLVDEARRRLAGCGCAPTVAVADGADGYPARAPYDRIIATCSVTHIPPAWLEQTRPGGVIVVNLFGRVWGAIARIEVLGRRAGRGRLLPEPAAFVTMGERPPRPSLQTLVRQMRQEDATSRPACRLKGFDDDSFQFLARLCLPNVVHFGLRPEGSAAPSAPCLFDVQDGSWARMTAPGPTGAGVVAQAGPRRLWDIYEHTHELWLEHGRPTRERYGLTLTPNGHQHVWLDTPDSDHMWSLPD